MTKGRGWNARDADRRMGQAARSARLPRSRAAGRGGLAAGRGGRRLPQRRAYLGRPFRSRRRHAALDSIAGRTPAGTHTCSGLTAVSALKKTREHVGKDDHLVIIGAGGVGGSAVHIAPAAVAGKVIVADIDAQKRAHARQMGAVATIDNSAPDAVKQVMEATGGGAAAAIDFVGSPKTMEFGVSILRKGGKLVMVGLYGGAHPVSTVLFPFKMMPLAGSYVGTLKALRELLALVQGGKVPPIPIETRQADEAMPAPGGRKC